MTEVFSQTVNIGNRINETDHNRGTKWERRKLKKFTSVIFPNLITKASISVRFPTITKEITSMSRCRNDKFIAREKVLIGVIVKLQKRSVSGCKSGSHVK